MRLFNQFGTWAHGDAFVSFVVVVAAVYIFVAIGVMVAA